MRFRRRPGVAPQGPSRATLTAALAAVAAVTLIAACSSSSSGRTGSGSASTWPAACWQRLAA